MATNTNVYIDGFNLYNGAVKNTPYKWLDLNAMCKRLFPQHNIKKIRYFTAIVKSYTHDPDAPIRQATYLRALRTISNITIHKDGWFADNAILLPQYPLAYRGKTPYTHPPQMVQVQRMEEKRTDVDLATQLLIDCFDKKFDEAIVISNDSDLVMPIETVKNKFGKIIGVVNPHKPYKMSGHLIRAASHYKRTINKSVLAACQLPPTLTDSNGTFNKPSSW